MAGNKTPGNQSGEKLIAIFEYLVRQGEPQKLQDIAKGLEMNTSTTLRFLTTLVNCNYVKQNSDTLRYEPTLKICALANKINKENALPKAARPYMQKLSDLFGESVCLGICGNDKVVYIEVMRVRNQSLMAVQAVGNAAPMYCNGIGKLFLAQYSKEKLERYLENNALEPYTEYTITDKDALKAELLKIQKNGYAFDNQEREIGARCLAFPIYGSNDEMIGGISVTGPYSRLTDDLLMDKIDDYREIMLQLSREVGYQNFNK